MERPAIIGHTFGAGIAAMAAARFPGRFSAVGVVDSPMNLSQAEIRTIRGGIDALAHDDLAAELRSLLPGPAADNPNPIPA